MLLLLEAILCHWQSFPKPHTRLCPVAYSMSAFSYDVTPLRDGSHVGAHKGHRPGGSFGRSRWHVRLSRHGRAYKYAMLRTQLLPLDEAMEVQRPCPCYMRRTTMFLRTTSQIQGHERSCNTTTARTGKTDHAYGSYAVRTALVTAAAPTVCWPEGACICSSVLLNADAGLRCSRACRRVFARCCSTV